MTNEMKTALVAINKWMYFGWNYKSMCHKGKFVPKFLAEVKWTCNYEHMLEKWESVTDRNVTNAYLVSFYAELDMPNRQALLEWVMNNYNDERPIF